jgi:FAD binding domain
MREVMRLSMVDHDITVQAGLGYVDLNAWLAQHGLWFPLDPGPGATLGGMCACRYRPYICVHTYRIYLLLFLVHASHILTSLH